MPVLERHKSRPFEVVAPFAPMGDQPQAIEELAARVRSGERFSCLLGATGTGKTFTMANVIARTGKPTLIISHNKTLAAQLFEELKEFLPHNSVNYFVSYYDYYQPEAYIPQRDIYIEKDASRNEELDQLRLAATSNILSRRDTVVVASVSCIFGLGSPEAYGEKVLTITRGSTINRRDFLVSLNAMQYQRADIEFKRGTYRVRGDTVDVWPAYERYAVRVDLFGDEIDRLELINPTSGEVLAEERQFFLFPAVHHVMPEDQMEAALSAIRAELDARVMELRHEGKLLEAQRLIARTKYDLEMMEEVGYCSGIENYSRFMDGRAPGERPFTLLDYFDYAPPDPHAAKDAPRDATTRAADGTPLRPTQDSRTEQPDARRYGAARTNLGDWLLIIDESHVTLPQIHAMFNGDRARKQVLVDHGFRLPAALDNRPLRFEEFEAIVPRVLFVSATPGPYELERVQGVVAEQVIRPTGLVDPEIEVRPAKDQVPDLIERCRERVAQGERVLVTALTKRLCEQLTSYLDDQGLRVRYLHSDIQTLERLEILADLRAGLFDVLVGVNLLREGLDLPEVSLVCILDADKEGFLRSPTSLIQQMGRAARNVNARVVMYADSVTPAMRAAMEETERRRVKQLAYNTEHDITPTTIKKGIRRGMEHELAARRSAKAQVEDTEPEFPAKDLLAALEEDMFSAAESLDFEKAAALRDQAKSLRERIAHAPDPASLTIRRSELKSMLGNASRSSGKKPGTPGSKSPRKKRAGSPRGGPRS
ncbi:MAG: excinuclease ABC subunit UvrB [Phycisphaerales bacterium]|jgi:excinuclease ABC subunit B|nr:excinuclease ABC subunit UvrB [Phycisphaerales bacterium]